MRMKADAQVENKYFYGYYCLICAFIHMIFKKRKEKRKGQPLYAFISCLWARALTP